MLIEKALDLLGLEARDVITGASGVITSVCFDLYGCVQGALTPSVDKDGKQRDGTWFDVKRLHTGERVMPCPQFRTEWGTEAGAAEKPAPRP